MTRTIEVNSPSVTYPNDPALPFVLKVTDLDNVGQRVASLDVFRRAEYFDTQPTNDVRAAIRGRNVIVPNARDFEWGVLGEAITSSVEKNAEAVGVYARVEKTAGAKSKAFGAAVAAVIASDVDASGVGMEVQMRAVDDHTDPADPLYNTGKRAVLDVVMATNADLGASRRAKADWGLRVRTNSGAKVADLAHGIEVSEDAAGARGQIDTAIYIRTSGARGIDLADSTFAGSAIRLGNDKWLNFNHAENMGVGFNSATNRVEIVTNGATPALAFTHFPNAVFLRLGGVLKQIKIAPANGVIPAGHLPLMVEA